MHAPLRVTGRGTPSTLIAFAGRQFAPVSTDGQDQFSSYRSTYRYRLYDGATWRWHVGFIGFIRQGGADVEEVFTFAWPNEAIVRVGARF